MYNKYADISGVYPCRFEIGVFQLRNGDAQLLFISAVYLCEYGHKKSGAPHLFMSPSDP